MNVRLGQTWKSCPVYARFGLPPTTDMWPTTVRHTPELRRHPSDASQSAKARRPLVVVSNVLTSRLTGVHHMAHAGHHRILVHIQTGAMRMKNFHAPS